MRIDFNVEIKNLKGEEVLGGPLMATEQLCNLAIGDRGETAATGMEAYKLNALMERIACADGPVDLSPDDVTLLKKLLDNALGSHRVSTFLVGRLSGILEGQTLDQGEDDKTQR